MLSCYLDVCSASVCIISSPVGSVTVRFPPFLSENPAAGSATFYVVNLIS
eukprot:m.29940 g.29940  ORF g.29940 m.29940 type:complete len:50 (+) comp31267_c0_seq2:268-417(+)